MSKFLYKNRWVSLKETNRGFVYAERRNVNSTASLLFKKESRGDYQFYLHFQPLPELKVEKKRNLKWYALYPCCVTGSLEPNEKPLNNAIKEIAEETNYVVNKSNIKISNISVASTQMNEVVYTYVVDITNAKQLDKSQGDGTYFENISENRWVSHKQLKNILLNNQNIYLSSLASAYLLFCKWIAK